MVKKVIAVLLGVLTGIVVVTLGDLLSTWAFPTGETVDFNNPTAVEAYMNKLPFGALIIMAGSWLLSAFFGGLMSAYIYITKPGQVSVVTGVILLIGSIINLYMIPHPLWMTITAVLGYIPMARIGGQVAVRLRG